MKNSRRRSRDVKRGIDYEKRKAREANCKHKGGPGNPDYICPDGTKAEVKRRKRKVTKPELMKMAKKGINIVHSLSGYTKPAIEYRNRYQPDITLCSRKRCQ